MILNIFNWRAVPTNIMLAAALGGFATSVVAQQSPYLLGVKETLEHDSNINRAEQGEGVTSDWLSTTGLFGSIVQPISRSTFRLDGEIDFNRFDKQKDLDNIGHSISFRDDWSSVNRLSGDFGASNSSQLYRYNPNNAVNAGSTNLRDTLTVNQAFADVHLGTVTPLTIDFASHFRSEIYSLSEASDLDFRRWDVLGGVTYRFDPDLNGSVALRHTGGRYPGYGDEFSRNDIVLGTFYAPTALTQFQAHLSLGRETHSVVSSPNSRSWSGDVDWFWQVTGKTQLSLTFLRDSDTGATPTLFSEFSNSDATEHTAVTGGIAYDVTSKLKASVNALYSHRKLGQVIVNIQDNETDKLYSGTFELDYAPTRMSKLSCSIGREHRTSTGPRILTYPYDDNVVKCGGQIAFD